MSCVGIPLVINGSFLARPLFAVAPGKEVKGDPLAGVEPLQAVDQLAASLIEQLGTLLAGQHLHLQRALMVLDADGKRPERGQGELEHGGSLRATQLKVNIHRQSAE